MAIGYKYNSRKVLGLIATDDSEITDTGDLYSYCFLYNSSGFSIHPVICTFLLGRYLNYCN